MPKHESITSDGKIERDTTICVPRYVVRQHPIELLLCDRHGEPLQHLSDDGTISYPRVKYLKVRYNECAALSKTESQQETKSMGRFSTGAVSRWPLAALALLFTGNVTQAQTTFSDGNFLDANWSASKIFDSTPGASASFGAFQSPTGGNPGAFRETQHSYSGPGGLAVGHLQTSAFFTPSLQGAIQTIDGSYDALVISVGSSAAVGYGLALKQNGDYYLKGGAAVFPGAGWTVRTFIGLTSADFGRVDDATFHPDFSLTGSSIQFGYYTGNGTAFGTPEASDSGIDNWTVSVNAAATPEPGSATLLITLCLGTAGFARRRRRR